MLWYGQDSIPDPSWFTYSNELPLNQLGLTPTRAAIYNFLKGQSKLRHESSEQKRSFKAK